ncbi:AsnC family protein [Streptomyces microflavus]|uniref:AsnC family protein n=1 Tax=Streptomyces microflavus TaxID=1919 RepID=UPI003652E2AA
MTTYSPHYTGTQWKIAQVELNPETWAPAKTVMEPRELAGPTVFWPDGTTSYVLHFRGQSATSWTVANETGTALRALEALRGGEEITPAALKGYLCNVRRLETRMTALKEELLLFAREPGPNGRARLPFRDIGEELGQHHSTVAERHQRILDGDTAQWRGWLTQYTERAAMYSNGGELPRPPEPRREHETGVYDSQEEPGKVRARCRCGWSGPAGTNTVTASRQALAHEDDPNA